MINNIFDIINKMEISKELEDNFRNFYKDLKILKYVLNDFREKTSYYGKIKLDCYYFIFTYYINQDNLEALKFLIENIVIFPIVFEKIIDSGFDDIFDYFCNFVPENIYEYLLLYSIRKNNFRYAQYFLENIPKIEDIDRIFISTIDKNNLDFCKVLLLTCNKLLNFEILGTAINNKNKKIFNFLLDYTDLNSGYWRNIFYPSIRERYFLNRILKKNVDINISTGTGQNPLILSIDCKIELFEKFLSYPEILINFGDCCETCPLLKLLKMKCINKFNLLISRKDLNVNISDKIGASAAEYAIRAGRNFKEFFDHPNYDPNHDPKIFLHSVISKDRYYFDNFLTNKDIHIIDEFGENAIFKIMKNPKFVKGYYEIEKNLEYTFLYRYYIETLIDLGVSCKIINKCGKNALYYMIKSSLIIKKLILNSDVENEEVQKFLKNINRYRLLDEYYFDGKNYRFKIMTLL